MKKHLTTFLNYALTMFMAFALTNCGSEVEIDDNNGFSVKPGQTVFSTGNDATRTSMDEDRYFYWETGDKIWVNSTGTTYLPSVSSTIGTQKKVASCNFVFDASLADQTYPVTYTGTNATSGTSVTIAKNQTQAAWNDGSHLGKSGDCGTATASRRGNGSYEFQLLHRAAYLVIYPFTPGATGCTLTQIEITSDNTIAGTYPFGADGLNTSTVTSPSSTITLAPASGSTFTMDNTSGKHLFAVIQPGTHSLTLKCTFKNASNDEFTNTKLLQAGRTFNENGITTVNVPLSEASANIDPELNFTFEDTYYMWDAKTWLFKDVPNYPKEHNQDAQINLSHISSTSWYNPIMPDVNNPHPHSYSSASFSAKEMPCRYAATWYVKDGVYYDNTTMWTIDGVAKTGGFWLKKWKYIDGKPEGSTIYNCPSGAPYKSGVQNGKPDASIINQYFFLPALGYFTYIEDSSNSYLDKFRYYAGWAIYWTSSAGGSSAEFIRLKPNSIEVSQATSRSPNYIYVAGTRPDGTPWFQ